MVLFISANLLACQVAWQQFDAGIADCAATCDCPPPAGPLEATIANLQRELAAREASSRELQRRWISVQGVLVGLQAENAELTEAVAAMRAQQAVMQQKRARLNGQ